MSEAKNVRIVIEVAPDGVHIRAEYTGTLASIPAAVERLRAAGVLDLVNTHRAPYRAHSDAPQARTAR
jgi:hypothetical protein